MPAVRIDVAPAFAPLLKPARYKGAYGGRGGAKSHFFAEQLLIRCYARTSRAVCIREIQNSIRDSVRQLLVDKIQKLGLGQFFEVLDAEIRGRNGSLIIFRGMQSYNAETIKSLEAYDIAWVEEAQTLSEKSLELLRPTIRKEGSEIWFSWNPRHRTDPVDQFFRKKPHPDAVSVFVNWRDNPWFPEVLQKEMLHDRATDEIVAEHVWEGAYGMDQGAILARHVTRAEREGRINGLIVYDPAGPGIEISSDVGFRDTSAWWFWQRRLGGGYALLDYDADRGLYAKDWIKRLQERLHMRQWKLGRVYLPHDALNQDWRTEHTGLQQFIGGFGPDKVRIVPKTSKTDRINAARTVIETCQFHAADCELGLDGLRAWKYEWDPDLLTFSKEPVHDWASHPSDAYSYGCQVMQDLPPPETEEDKTFKGWETQSLDELWKKAPGKGGRL